MALSKAEELNLRQERAACKKRIDEYNNKADAIGKEIDKLKAEVRKYEEFANIEETRLMHINNKLFPRLRK